MAITVPVEFDGDFSDLGSGLNQSLDKGSRNASNKAAKAFSGLPAKVAKIGLAAGAALGAGAAVGITKSISAASELDESFNAVQVSFGDAADEVLKLGENSATAFGLSQSELNGYAVQFSAFTSQIAGADGDVAGTFENLIGRATDFASVMNIEVGDAAGSFQSALAGETEPLRKFGIDLSAATVESFAYANGIAKAGEELTEQQKVQARYGSLMEQTAKTQGDFANTSDGLANQQRILSANFEDLQATLGSAFLPIMAELVGVLNDALGPAMETIAEVAPQIGEVIGEVVGTVADGIASLIGDADEIGPKFEEVAAAFEPFATKFQEMLPDIIEFGQSLQEDIGTIITNLQPVITSFAEEILPLILSAIEEILPIIEGLFGWLSKVSEILGVVLPPIISVLAPLFEGAFTIIGGVISSVFEGMEGWLTFLTGIFSGDTEQALEGLGMMWEAFKKAITSILEGAMEQVIGIIDNFFPGAQELFDKGWEDIKQGAEDKWNELVGMLASFISELMVTIPEGIGNIRRGVTDAWNTLVATTQDHWNRIVNAVTSKVDEIITTARELPGRVVSAMGNLGSRLFSAGRDLIQGLINGIRNIAGSVASEARNVVSNAINAAKEALKIGSPSKVFMGIGEDTGEGLAIGLRDSAGVVSKATGAMMGGLTNVSAPTPRARPLGADAQARQAGQTIVNLNEYGPRTNAAKRREIEYALKYSTHNRTFPTGSLAVA